METFAYILKRDDHIDPFAVVSSKNKRAMVELAIIEEFDAESVEITNWKERIDWGHNHDLKCTITSDGDVYELNIEIIKVVNY